MVQNGKKILYADNMFRNWTTVLSKEEDLQPTNNVLLLHFKSAKKLAKDLEKQFGRVRAGSANLGDPSRVYVRKAQYGWRWDWVRIVASTSCSHTDDARRALSL